MDSVFGVPFAHSIRMLLKSSVNLFDKTDAVVVEHHKERVLAKVRSAPRNGFGSHFDAGQFLVFKQMI